MTYIPSGGGIGSQGASKTIFVCNIPYDATEQQVRDILSTAGRIVHIRFVYDSQSGKPKGYAFCEYLDAATAQSAIRNLNNYDLNGRSLRIDMADEDKPPSRDRKSQQQQSQLQ
jgi:cleavage stimulation factor subunit 2